MVWCSNIYILCLIFEVSVAVSIDKTVFEKVANQFFKPFRIGLFQVLTVSFRTENVIGLIYTI